MSRSYEIVNSIEFKNLTSYSSKKVLKVGVISQAKGSAYIEMGKTKVICAVYGKLLILDIHVTFKLSLTSTFFCSYGPREIAKRLDFGISGRIYCELKYAPFSCQFRKQWHPDGEERDLSQVLKQALEPAVCLVIKLKITFVIISQFFNFPFNI